MPDKLVYVKPSKARVALWMASRPAFWPDLWRRAKLNIGRKLVPAPMGQGAATAAAWAGQLAIDEDAALARLGLPAAARFNQLHADLAERAARIERESSETLGGGGGVDLIFRVCEGLKVRTAVETGVAYGWSSLAILASVSTRGGHLYSVDMPSPQLKDEGLTGCVVPAELAAGWTLIREPDWTGLRKVLKLAAEIDFVHYDSEKSYAGRATSYRLLWSRLRSGGILMSDDIADNTAFRDFAAEAEIDPVVVYSEGSGLSGARYVGLLKKP